MLLWLLLQSICACGFSFSRYDEALLDVQRTLALRGHAQQGGPLHHDVPMFPADQLSQNALNHDLPPGAEAPPGLQDAVPPKKEQEAVVHPKKRGKQAASLRENQAKKAPPSAKAAHDEKEAHKKDDHHGKSAHHDKHHGEGKGANHSKHHKDEKEHAEHHGKEGEHHHAPDPESLSLAYFLMGGVGALMVVFHFASSRDLEIKLATWKVLNMTLSIFVAVLIYSTVKTFIEHAFQPGRQTMVAITLIGFLVLFVGSHFILFKLKRGDSTQLQAAGTILAHMCGFAAMYGFADSAEVKYVEQFESVGFAGMIIFAAVTIGALTFAMDKVMKKVADSDGVMDESERKWIETCDEADDDIFCLAISFLLALFFKFAILGKQQHYEHHRSPGVNQSHANALLACAVLFGVLVAIGALAMVKAQSRLRSEKAQRFATVVQHLNSMIMAWTFLFWAEWQIHVAGWDNTVIGACLFISVFMTMFGFVAASLMYFIQVHIPVGIVGLRRAMNSLELALGVLVGFSWERAFDVAFEEVYLSYHGSSLGMFIVTLMSIVLIAAVGPAWRNHILPKVEELEAVTKQVRQVERDRRDLEAKQFQK